MVHEQRVLEDADRNDEAHHAQVLQEVRARELDQLRSLVAEHPC